MKTAAIAMLAALAGVFVSPVVATADTSHGTDCPTGLHVLVVCNKGIPASRRVMATRPGRPAASRGQTDAGGTSNTRRRLQNIGSGSANY